MHIVKTMHCLKETECYLQFGGPQIPGDKSGWHDDIWLVLAEFGFWKLCLTGRLAQNKLGCEFIVYHLLHANCFFTHFGISGGSDTYQRDLGRLEKWASVNIMKCNKARSCRWTGAIPNISTVERGEWTGSSCEEKDLGILVDSQTHIGYEVAVCVCSPECQLCHGLPQKQCEQQDEGGEVIPHCSALWDPTWSTASALGHPT